MLQSTCGLNWESDDDCKDLTLRKFGHYLVDAQSKGDFQSWKSYFDYLMSIFEEKMPFKKFQLTQKACHSRSKIKQHQDIDDVSLQGLQAFLDTMPDKQKRKLRVGDVFNIYQHETEEYFHYYLGKENGILEVRCLTIRAFFPSKLPSELKILRDVPISRFFQNDIFHNDFTFCIWDIVSYWTESHIQTKKCSSFLTLKFNIVTHQNINYLVIFNDNDLRDTNFCVEETKLSHGVYIDYSWLQYFKDTYKIIGFNQILCAQKKKTDLKTDLQYRLKEELEKIFSSPLDLVLIIASYLPMCECECHNDGTEIIGCESYLCSLLCFGCTSCHENKCPQCGDSSLCVKHHVKCQSCDSYVCAKCSTTLFANCGHPCCEMCSNTCKMCRKRNCGDCLVECEICQENLVCQLCIKKCSKCDVSCCNRKECLDFCVLCQSNYCIGYNCMTNHKCIASKRKRKKKKNDNATFFFVTNRKKKMSKEAYKDRKVSGTASHIFFAKYYDDLKLFFSEYKEIKDVWISFDRACVNLDLELLFPKNDKIQFELQRRILRFCNKEKIFASINYCTAAEYRKNPISYKNLALLKFSEDGKLQLFKQALDDGADYNYVFKNEWGRCSNITPLFLAAYNDHQNITEHIIALASEKGELEQVVNYENSQGFTAFTIAYYMGSVSVFEFLFLRLNKTLSNLSTCKKISEQHILRSLYSEEILLRRSYIDDNHQN